jgi:hypothetical protein
MLMRKNSRAVLSIAACFVTAGAASAAIALTGVASGGGSSHAISGTSSGSTHTPKVEQSTSNPTLIPAPTPQVHTIPATEQAPYVSGPYLTMSQAEADAMQVADRMGSGAQVVAAKLESVATASTDAGFRVATFETSTSRKVWLVWIIGPYQGGCLTSTCPARSNVLYNVTIDATSGTVYGVGTSKNMPGAPSVPPNVARGPAT